MQLVDFHCAADVSARAGHVHVDLVDAHLFEHDLRYVLRSVNVTHVRMGRHDQRRRGLVVDDPGPFGVGDLPVLVSGVVLTEVPHRAVVGLRVPVDGHLLDPAVQVRDVLDDRRVDRRAAIGRRLRLRQQGHLGAERLVVHVPAVDDLLDTAGRMQRVRDRGRVAELRRGEVDAFTIRRDRQALIGVFAGFGDDLDALRRHRRRPAAARDAECGRRAARRPRA